jgi:excisionase family DNA binding protein
MSKTSKDLVVTIPPTAQKSDVVEQLEKVYQQAQNKLVSASGKEIVISDTAFEILEKILPTLESRRATITITPAAAELTTQQAADALNVSRPYLIKLLEEGEIPYVMVGNRRRVRSDDLEKYQENRNAQRKKLRAELTDLMEEEGLFD